MIDLFFINSHSYAGRINVCFCADPGQVKDMPRLAELFKDQLDELAKEVGVEL